ncbi:MAG TPA: hypothetical protein VLA58_08900 [Chitinophagaceae bacterium]|nr:hypothetical protein [Chitinophagaceae bacterium]
MNRKKVIPLILLTILASAPLLMPAYFMISRSIARHEMLEKLENQNLVSVQVPASEFQWYEEGREIIINGKMFDVKSIELSHGVYFVTGLFDEKETQLKQALQNNLEDQQNEKIASQQLVQFITSFADLNEPILALNAWRCSMSQRTLYQDSYIPQYFGSIVVPPPDCFSSF